MHKNTFLLISILAVIAALVVGINMGKRMAGSQTVLPSPTQNPIPTETIFETPTPSGSISATPKSSPTISTQSGVLSPTPAGSGGVFTSSACGVSVRYPAGMTVQDGGEKGAVFTSASNAGDIVVLTCQKDIPLPALTPEKIETKTIDGVPAKLYHDSSEKDGTSVDALIFTHPKNGMDVFVGGFGSTFNSIIQTITIAR